MTRGRLTITATVGLLVLGLVIGVVGAVVSAARTTVGSVMVPWGLILLLVLLPTFARAVAWSTGTRAAAALFAAGWAVATAAAVIVRPGDDVLFPDGPRATVYVLGGAALLVLACLVPVRRAPEVPEPLAPEPSALEPSGVATFEPAPTAADDAAVPTLDPSGEPDVGR